MSRDLYVTARVTLPGADLSWVAVRASGPGGQNVNKVSTKVELRFDLARTRALEGGAKSRLRLLAAGRIDADGRMIVTSQVSRSQERNLEDAREKLAGLVSAALTVPKKRKKTRPSRAARTERLEGKRHHAEKKQTRGRVRLDD